MASVKLSEAFMKKLTSTDPANPEAGPKRSRFVADAGHNGLMVNVTQAGTKTFHVRWTDKDGKSQRIAIPGGTWPLMRVDVAREKAFEIRREVAAGRNPKAEKKAKRAGASAEGPLTVGELIEAWDRLKLAEQRAGYRRDAAPTLRRGLADHLKTPAADLTRRIVVGLSEGRQAEGRRGAARNLITYCSAMYGWAVKTGRVEVNPLIGAPRPPVNKPERVLSNEEVGAVYAAAALRPYPSGPYVQLLLLTGVRLREAAAMEWAELDAEMKVWTVPAGRMKNHKPHEVHLSEPARAILRAIKDSARLAGSRYVFTTTGETAFSGFSNVKAQLDAVSGVSAWRLHDLRHTIATHMGRLGVAPHVADLILAHTMPGIMGRYQHGRYDVERREALALWAAHVAEHAERAMPAVTERAASARAEHRVKSSVRLKAVRAAQTAAGRKAA